MERLPSEVIQDFLDYLKECQDKYEEAKEIVEEESKKTTDYIHAIEFEGRCDERSKIATNFRQKLLRRRKAKDEMEMLEKVVQYTKKEQNKLFFRTLKTLISDQIIEEKRLSGEREYKPRTDAWKDMGFHKKGGDKS